MQPDGSVLLAAAAMATALAALTAYLIDRARDAELRRRRRSRRQ